MEITMTNDLSEVGKKLYEQKLFKEAAAIYEIAVTNVNSKNNMLDNFYLGNSLYRLNKDIEKPDLVGLQRADSAFEKVIEASPTGQEAYLLRARINSLLDKGDLMIKFYEEFLRIMNEKGIEEISKPIYKLKLIESYNTIAANYVKTDKIKAKEYFSKTLALDPTDAVAIKNMKLLK
jgi:tetratricopeptide (TPR) repeat protein